MPFDEPEADRESVRIRFEKRPIMSGTCFYQMPSLANFMAIRVYGPYAPQEGHRFNASKVVIDPYARAIAGKVLWGPEMFAYPLGGPAEDLKRDYQDNVALIPKCVVVDPHLIGRKTSRFGSRWQSRSFTKCMW